MDWSLVFDSLPTPAACLAPEPAGSPAVRRFELLAVNRAFASLFGQPVDALVGRDLLEVVVGLGAGRADWDRALSRPLVAGEKAYFLRPLPGLECWLGVEADLMADGTLVALFADLTRHVRTRSTASSEQHNLLAIFDGMDDFIYVADPDTHELLYMNAAMVRVFGPGVGQKCYQVLHGGDGPCSFCNNPRLFGPEPEDSIVWEVRNQVVGRWFRCLNRVIPWSSGRLARLEIAVDIDRYKRAEAELRVERGRAQQYLDVAGVMLISLDEAGRVSLINPKGCEILGGDEADIVGRDWFETFATPDRSGEVKRVFDRIMAGDVEPVEYYENPIRRLDGGTRIVAWHNSLLRDDQGAIVGLFSSGEDITDRRRSEEALRASEEMFRTLVQHQAEGIGIADVDDQFLFANPAAGEIFGLEPDEMIGCNLMNFLNEDGQAELDRQNQSRAQGETGNYELPIVRSDGQRRWIHVTAVPRYDASGRLDGTFGIFRDVTAERTARQEIERAYAVSRTILDRMPIGVMVVGRDRRIRRINRAGCDLIGVTSPEDAIGGACHEFFCQAEEGCCPVLDEGVRVEHKEREIFRRDGTPVPVLKTVHMIELDGEPVQLETFVDLTERNRALQALRDSEEMFRTISTSARDGIVVIDDHGKVTVWNEAAEKIFGYRADEARGKDLHSLVASDEMIARHAEAFGRFRESGQGAAVGQTLELPGLRKDGSKVPVELSLSAAEMGGRWHGVGIVRDISARKDAEEVLHKAKEETDAANQRLELAFEQANRMAADAEAANQTKSRFLANMSHEIRTPMNGVIGMIELLLRTELDPEQRDFAETVRTSATHLLALVNDILDFSKVEAGKLALERIAFSPAAIVEQVVDLMGVKAAEKELVVGARLGPDLPEQVLGDPGRLRQVLINLTNNAVKFTSAGRVTLQATVGRNDTNKVEVLFSVSDTGVGIPQQKVEGIFRAFEQADDSTTRVYGGTGLGLAISKHLVELMGSELRVESRVGEGSTFWFEAAFQRVDAPAVSADRDAAAILQERPSEVVSELSAEAKRRARLLLVEDNPTNRKVALAILDRGGYTAQVAENGSQALEALARESFDLVLMDVQMPGMDGLEATRLLRTGQRGVLRKDVPVIAMTGHALQGDRERFLNAGMDGYISKPVAPDELLGTVARWLAFQSSEGSDPVSSPAARPAAIANSAGPADLDWEGLVARMVEDADIAREVLAGFLEEAPGLVAALGRALDEQDAQAAVQVAHQLKGAAGNAGAEALHRAAAEIEHQARQGRLGQGNPRSADLNDMLCNLERSAALHGVGAGEAKCNAS